MRNTTIGLITAIAFAPTAVFAFSSSDDIKTTATLGSCTVNIEVNTTSGKAYVGVSANVAGGSYWINGEITPGKLSMSEAQLSSCLNTPVSNISGLSQDGANGTFAGDDYIGFRFSLTEAAGGLSAGVHEYKVGSGSLPSSGDGGPDVAVVNAVAQQLSSQISSTQRLVRESRDRFITSRQQMAGDSAGIASRNNVDFDVDGSLNADNGRVSTNGSFFEQAGNFDGTYRRLFFGDFDVQHDSDTDSTTATVTGKVAWEQMLDDNNMLGYFLGANLAYSDIGGTFSGKQNSYGVSAGAYFVSALQENLFFDGFLSVGAGHNELELADGTVDLKGDYTSYTTTIGAALSGVIERDGYEIWPEIALSYGYTDLGTIGLTDRNAGSVDNRVSVDADSVSIANLTIRPEFRIPMDGLAVADSRSLFTFAPRLICEQVKTVGTTEDCGGGAEFGFNTTSQDGNSRFVARIKADRIASSTRTGLELKLEHQF